MSCEATVEFCQGYSTLTGTWVAVQVAATRLNMICVGPKAIGGWTTIGRKDEVRIVLDYPTEPIMIENGTMTNEIA